MVTFFPLLCLLLGTCGQAYWLSLVYFLMFTVRIWTKSNCLHCLVFGKKVWKKENQGRCHKLYRQWFMPCLDFDLVFYSNSLQLIRFPKGMLLKPKELKAYCLLADCYKCTLLWALSSEHLNSSQTVVVGHCQTVLSAMKDSSSWQTAEKLHSSGTVED